MSEVVSWVSGQLKVHTRRRGALIVAKCPECGFVLEVEKDVIAGMCEHELERHDGKIVPWVPPNPADDLRYSLKEVVK